MYIPPNSRRRRMTVCRGPTLRLQGCWFERAGFPSGTKVNILLEEGRRLVLQAVDREAEIEAAIKAEIRVTEEHLEERAACHRHAEALLGTADMPGYSPSSVPEITGITTPGSTSPDTTNQKGESDDAPRQSSRTTQLPTTPVRRDH
jgi:hypothetical protein